MEEDGLAESKLPRVTADDMCNPKLKVVPGREEVLLFIDTCLSYAVEKNIDLGNLGDRDALMSLYDTMAAGIDRAPRKAPARTGTPPPQEPAPAAVAADTRPDAVVTLAAPRRTSSAVKIGLVSLAALLVVLASLGYLWFQHDTSPPKPVTELLAQAATDRVTLAWPQPPGGNALTRYVLRRNDHSIMNAQLTTYTDHEVTPGSTYLYEVSVIDADGVESPRTRADVTLPTQSATLKPPVAVTATADARSVKLSFAVASDAPAGATYTVLRDGIAIGQTAELSYTDTAASPDTQYVYTVRTNDPGRNEQSADSDPVTVRTLPATSTPGGGGGDPTPAGPEERLPTAPGGLRRTASAQTTISMTWSASTAGSSPISGYRIYRDGQVRRNVGPTTLTFQDTGLTAGTSHRYAVKAYDTSGRESASSTTVTMSTAAAPKTPTPFVRISPSSGSATTRFHISGQGPPDTYIGIVITDSDGKDYYVGGNIPTDSTGSFVSAQEGPNFYLLNNTPGHEGEIVLEDDTYLTLKPGRYVLTFTEIAQQNGFHGSASLTIN
ncbi:hypothetical protein Cs7R123_47270 [Catellatospora sp. TT07R-123]|nr:hypothetical protein Cs7R123_47270 [Catellatospora sp. TT07R-123]